VPHDEGGRLRAALHAKLGQQRRHVVLHRLFGQEHALGDLAVGQSLADQVKHPLLLLGQRPNRVHADGTFPQPGHDLTGRARVEYRLAGGDRAQGTDQVGAARLLRYVARGTGHDRAEKRLIVAVSGEHQARGLRQRGADFPADRDAVPVGQPDIENRHVRTQRGHPGQRRRRGLRLADHVDVRLGGQQGPDAAPEDLVVIDEEDADPARVPGVLIHPPSPFRAPD
jgi:hypothetical protein